MTSLDVEIIIAILQAKARAHEQTVSTITMSETDPAILETREAVYEARIMGIDNIIELLRNISGKHEGKKENVHL